ncbi:hypothetical protein SRB5_59610 [Streptomyces sp. RB5]|uniref:DUF397 domain-containing protein n=1 Tax=Streptomyces smaragdinus TaxID=2585196 RepID=A0A7K0CQK8_9ACTN|nr:DUF397 domain-containing protein [Streptomyces smaragdinus]MQY15770.1 hypothetical protein [Streptomyces smaragdinus]
MTTINGADRTAPELGAAVWRKSSYSGGSESQCIEVADLTRTPHGALAVRDSKNPHGPALLFTPDAFAGFVDAVRRGEFGLQP